MSTNDILRKNGEKGNIGIRGPVGDCSMLNTAVCPFESGLDNCEGPNCPYYRPIAKPAHQDKEAIYELAKLIYDAPDFGDEEYGSLCGVCNVRYEGRPCDRGAQCALYWDLAKYILERGYVNNDEQLTAFVSTLVDVTAEKGEYITATDILQHMINFTHEVTPKKVERTSSVLEKIYNLLCEHGTTYVKNYIRDEYGIGPASKPIGGKDGSA